MNTLNTAGPRSGMLRRALAAGSVLALLWGTSACGSDDGASAAEDGTSGGAALTIEDPWVKSVDKGMTAAFGTLSNDSGEDLRVIAGETGISTETELHEMVSDGGEMVMREKKDGFVIPAGGTHELTPGGDHLMLMDVTDPVEPGDDISITLELQDGTKMTFDAPARSFSGAKEEYQGDGEMDMGSQDRP